jgi:pentatricopeptide repeat protein
LLNTDELFKVTHIVNSGLGPSDSIHNSYLLILQNTKKINFIFIARQYLIECKYNWNLERAKVLIELFKRNNLKIPINICNQLIMGVSRNNNIDDTKEIQHLIRFTNQDFDLLSVSFNSFLKTFENDLQMTAKYIHYNQQALADLDVQPTTSDYSDQKRAADDLSNQQKQLSNQQGRNMVAPNKSIELDVFHYTTLLNTLLLKNPVDFLGVYQEFRQKNIKPTLPLYTVLLRYYLSENKISEAYELFDQIHTELKLTTGAANIMIQGLFENERVSEAIHVYSQFTNLGITPDEKTFGILINQCSSRGDLI